MDESRKTVPPAALSIPEVATYLGVSADTVRRLIRGGDIPHARIGNSIRVPRLELEGYLRGQTTREWKRVDRRGRRAAG
jgi:excisionase family DNA binding protein